MRFRARLKYRAELTLFERMAKLEAQECVCRIPRHRLVVALLYVGDHREISIADRLIELESIVVGNCRHSSTDAATARFDLGPHLFNVGQCLKMKALVIEEENISRLIVCNSLRDAEARHHAL